MVKPDELTMEEVATALLYRTWLNVEPFIYENLLGLRKDIQMVLLTYCHLQLPKPVQLKTLKVNSFYHNVDVIFLRRSIQIIRKK